MKQKGPKDRAKTLTVLDILQAVVVGFTETGQTVTGQMYTDTRAHTCHTLSAALFFDIFRTG